MLVFFQSYRGSLLDGVACSSAMFPLLGSSEVAAFPPHGAEMNVGCK